MTGFRLGKPFQHWGALMSTSKTRVAGPATTVIAQVGPGLIPNWNMENQLDQRGNPICPVCGLSILPAESVAKRHTYMTHIHSEAPAPAQ